MDQNNDNTTPEGTAAEPTGKELNVASAPNAPAVASAQPQPEAHTLQKVFYQQAQEPPRQDSGSFAAAAEPVKPHSTFRASTVGILVGGVTAFAVIVGGSGFALGASFAGSDASTSSAVTATPQTYTQPNTNDFLPTSPFGGQSGSGSTGGSDSSSGLGGSATSPSTGTTDTSTAATAATDEQTEGVVTIVSTLYYSETTQAAGTGVILTSDGQILTNNHVIDGATSIEVTVESTGKTYDATVVGTDSTNDIALLQLDDASGLDVSTTNDGTLAVGDEATSIGNAEGTGDLVAAAGSITALNEAITVGNEYTGASESLSGLIEVDADVVSGDSGGPLVDDNGDVIGIVTPHHPDPPTSRDTRSPSKPHSRSLTRSTPAMRPTRYPSAPLRSSGCRLPPPRPRTVLLSAESSPTHPPPPRASSRGTPSRLSTEPPLPRRTP